MRIIHTVGSLAPETGGPARSVPNLALALAEEGVEVTILSLDLRGRFSAPLIPSHPLLRTILVPSSISIGMRTIWVPEFRKTLDELCNQGKFHLIHDHGVWLPQNGIAARMAERYNLPLIISPRGMLQPWAMQYHRFRKSVAWLLFQKQRFHQADLLHATSHSEEMSIRRLGLSNPVCVIPNGTELPDIKLFREDKRINPRRRILFLSRIHPNKGLLMLVQAVSQVQDLDWELVIAGYDENNHQQEVQEAVREAGLTGMIKFHGPVPDREKWDYFPQFDYFILPSYSENYGIVVAEALACGVPVITTTGTPWEDLARYNCGWWVDPTIDNLAEALNEAINLPEKMRKEMGLRGRNLVEEKYSWQAIAKEMVRVYHYLTEDSSPPGTISFS